MHISRFEPTPSGVEAIVARLRAMACRCTAVVEAFVWASDVSAPRAGALPRGRFGADRSARFVLAGCLSVLEFPSTTVAQGSDSGSGFFRLRLWHTGATFGSPEPLRPMGFKTSTPASSPGLRLELWRKARARAMLKLPWLCQLEGRAPLVHSPICQHLEPLAKMYLSFTLWRHQTLAYFTHSASLSWYSSTWGRLASACSVYVLLLGGFFAQSVPAMTCYRSDSFSPR